MSYFQIYFDEDSQSDRIEFTMTYKAHLRKEKIRVRYWPKLGSLEKISADKYYHAKWDFVSGLRKKAIQESHEFKAAMDEYKKINEQGWQPSSTYDKVYLWQLIN